MKSYAVFSGSANTKLAEAIAQALDVPLAPCTIEHFPDGEISVKLQESVRRREVFIVQPTCRPVNDRLVELLAFADACRRADASHVTAVIPYFGYARSDRRAGHRRPIMATMVADLMQTAGIGQVMTMDIHTPQVEGFFRIPFDDLSAAPTLASAICDNLPEDAVVVAPDLGAVKRATTYSYHLGRPTVILHKRRKSGSEVEVSQVIGDVRGRSCIIVDDMISTGGTIVQAINALRNEGANPDFTVVATHGVFTEGARERLREAGAGRVIVSDTIQVESEGWPELQVVSVAPLIASALQRLATGESLRGLGANLHDS